MKITVDVEVNGNTIFAEAFYDLPEAAPDRALSIAREVEQLMTAYPSYSVINIQIEKDADEGKDVQKPTDG